jgi:hypothetical protein
VGNGSGEFSHPINCGFRKQDAHRKVKLKTRMLIFGFICLLFLLTPLSFMAAAKHSPFQDALVVRHMADLDDSARNNSRLTANGGVETGIELKGAERQASLTRGGDGPADWHDAIVRYAEARADLFIDGVRVDEDFPLGPLWQTHEQLKLLTSSEQCAI